MVTEEAKPTLYEQVKVFLDAGGYSYQKISKEVLVDAKISEFPKWDQLVGDIWLKWPKTSCYLTLKW